MKTLHTALHVFRNVVPIFVGLVVLTLLIAWLAGAFTSKISPGTADVPLRRLEGQPVEEVHEVTKDYIEEAVGTLKAASRTIVSAKILATIEEIKVAAGDQVQPGALLVRLSSDEADARLRQAEQSLVAAEAAHQEAAAALARAKRLKSMNPQVISQAEFDETVRREQVTQAQQRSAEQAVKEAKVLLSYTTITASKGGRIVDRLAEPGDTARPGQPLLVLYDATSLRLEAPVAERRAVHLKVGDKLGVYIDALDREIEASIDEIVPQAEAPSRSFLVKAAVPYEADLYEGMFGRLLIPAGERRHLCLPTAAIIEIGQLQFVDVVQPDETLSRRLIKTGRLGMPGRVEVLSGLRPGDRVVLYQHPDAPTSGSESTVDE